MATPTGYSGQSAIQMVRNRTGQTASVPADATILTFLNAGIEQVESRLGAIFAVSNIPVLQGASSVPLSADMQSIININFSITLPTASNAMLYPVMLVQEGAFERLTGYAPGSSSGFPTIAFVQSDASGVMTLQWWPIVQTAGFCNLYYKQRPTLWADTSSSSATNLDTAFQELAILWACANVCENRAMFGTPLQYFQARFEKELEKINEDAKFRTLPGRVQVADVTSVPTNTPYWYDLD